MNVIILTKLGYCVTCIHSYTFKQFSIVSVLLISCYEQGGGMFLQLQKWRRNPLPMPWRSASVAVRSRGRTVLIARPRLETTTYWNHQSKDLVTQLVSMSVLVRFEVVVFFTFVQQKLRTVLYTCIYYTCTCIHRRGVIIRYAAPLASALHVVYILHILFHPANATVVREHRVSSAYCHTVSWTYRKSSQNHISYFWGNTLSSMSYAE